MNRSIWGEDGTLLFDFRAERVDLAWLVIDDVHMM